MTNVIKQKTQYQQTNDSVMKSRNRSSLLITSSILVASSSIAIPVYAVDYLTVPQAQKIIFSKGNEIFLEESIELTKQQKKAIKKASGVRQRKNTQPIWRVIENGVQTGWFIQDDVIGKHEFITYAVGISTDGEVKGMEILSYRETHGGEVKESEWRDNFKGKTLNDPFLLDKDVPNISGATLSSRNLLDGVKRLLVLQHIVLKPLTDKK